MAARSHDVTSRPGLRARVLLKLERWFAPKVGPRHGDEHARYEFEKASGSYQPLIDQIGGIAGKTVLDFGCGWGGETAWLAQHCNRAVGVDIDSDSLDAARAFARNQRLANLSFVHVTDDTLPFDDNTFDVVLSTNVFEHVMQPRAVLAELHRVLKPGGAFVSTFGPLFYSPLGYHLPWAIQVPFAHLLFGLKPMMQVRNLKRTPSLHVQSWEQTGLNRITYRQFTRAVRATGWDVRQLDRIAVKNLNTLARLPLVGDLLTFGIRCHLVKPAAAMSVRKRAA